MPILTIWVFLETVLKGKDYDSLVKGGVRGQLNLAQLTTSPARGAPTNETLLTERLPV